MAVDDPLVVPLALELLECLQQEIAKVPSPPARVELRPGVTVPHGISQSDNECCSGLAWVRPAAFYPSSTAFPVQDDGPLPKVTTRAWAVTLEMGAIRCAPTPGADRSPTADEWAAVVFGQMDDAAAMRRAICCFIDGKPGRAQKVLPGIWTPLEVEGGCAGGILSVTIRGPICDCADAGPESS